MTHNPYAPPGSPTLDTPAAGESAGPPPQIARACTLLRCAWGVTQLGLVVTAPTIMTGADPTGADPIGAFVVGFFSVLLLGSAITYWVTNKLRAGRNWMRLLVTFWCALNLASLVIAMIKWSGPRRVLARLTELQGSGGAWATLTQFALILAAVVLVNTPSARAWFARMKARAQSTT